MYLSRHLSTLFTYPDTYLSMYLSRYLSTLFTYPDIYLSMYLSRYLSTLFTYPDSYLATYPCAYPDIYLLYLTYPDILSRYLSNLSVYPISREVLPWPQEAVQAIKDATGRSAHWSHIYTMYVCMYVYPWKCPTNLFPYIFTCSLLLVFGQGHFIRTVFFPFRHCETELYHFLCFSSCTPPIKWKPSRRFDPFGAWNHPFFGSQWLDL